MLVNQTLENYTKQIKGDFKLPYRNTTPAGASSTTA